MLRGMVVVRVLGVSQQLTLAARGSQDARRRRRVLTGIVGAALVYGIISCPPASAQAISPHGEYGLNPESAKCTACHAPHNAAASRLLAHEATTTVVTQSLFCYRCHGDLGPASGNAKASFDEGLPSGHRVEDSGEASPADLTNTCASCHDPHADSTTELRLPREAINGKTVDGADNTWCFACHDDQDSWYRSLDVGAYPALSAPMRAASGYPTTGTFPGSTVYATLEKNAHANIPAGTMTESGGAARVAGDCLWCHSGHRGVSEYDGLIARFNASTAELKDTRDGEYAEVCFRCHAKDLAEGIEFVGSPVIADVASSALTTDTASTRSNGHRVRNELSVLPQNAPLPCYECHNPHGSKNGNTRLISDVLGSGLDVSTDAGMRSFCFTCHTTSDGDASDKPFKWDSTTTTYVAVTGSEAPVVGLDRATDLRLSATFGHSSGQTDVNCLTECHDDVHNPVVPTAATSCFSGGCHSALHGMVDATVYTSDETSDSDLLGKPVYHHVLNAAEPDRGPGENDDYPVFDADNQELYCISCHVGHSEWDGLGVAYNLRNSGTSASPQAANTDEGLCLSCHSYTLPFRIERSADGVTPTPAGQADNALPATAVMRVEDDMWGYDPDLNDPSGNLVPAEDRSPHNYQVSTYFEKGNSEFKGNCSKCHGVLTPGQYGEAQPFSFTVHFSPEQRLLNALGQDRNTMTLETDGQTAAINEEDMCFRCHSNSVEKGGLTLQGSLPYSYTEYDYYGEKWMKESTRAIAEQMNGNPFGHRPYAYYKSHLISSIDETQDYISRNKHVECADCHNHHVVGESRHIYGTTNLVSDALKGVRGVGFGVDAAAIKATLGDTDGSGPDVGLVSQNYPGTIDYGGTNSELVYKQMATYEYEVCFKCHSSANANLNSSVTGPAWDSSWTNVAQDFNVGNNSRHPVFATLDGYYYDSQDKYQLDLRDFELGGLPSFPHPGRKVLIDGYPDYLKAVPDPDPVSGITSPLEAAQVSNGWEPGDTMMCSDCHGPETDEYSMVETPTVGSGVWVPNPAISAVPQGPHGSSVRFSLRGPGTDWPVRTDLATPRPIILNDFNDTAYRDNVFCTNCHPAAKVASNRAHSAAVGLTKHGGRACINCHVLVPHGSKISRLIGDGDSPNMPARLAYEGNRSNMMISSYQKGASTKNSCAVVSGSACTQGQGAHTVTGSPTTGNWENW